MAACEKGDVARVEALGWLEQQQAGPLHRFVPSKIIQRQTVQGQCLAWESRKDCLAPGATLQVPTMCELQKHPLNHKGSTLKLFGTLNL